LIVSDINALKEPINLGWSPQDDVASWAQQLFGAAFGQIGRDTGTVYGYAFVLDVG
jgi:hypothetical protein